MTESSFLAPNFSNLSTTVSSSIVGESTEEAVGFCHAFIASLSIILVSELGDKTWFIAAIMATSHSNLTVFSGAMTALGLITVLSGRKSNIMQSTLGWITDYIPHKILFYITAVLFAFCGLQMLYDGWHMDRNAIKEEYKVAKEQVKKTEDLTKIALESISTNSSEKEKVDLEKQNSNEKTQIVDLENCITDPGIKKFNLENSGALLKSKTENIVLEAKKISLKSEGGKSGTLTIDLEVISNKLEDASRMHLTLYISTVFLKVFTLTFVMEWGDRSQLTTIILGARESTYGVIFGGMLAHAICTGIAVLGGRLAAKHISLKKITIIGGIVFLLCAFVAIFFETTDLNLFKSSEDIRNTNITILNNSIKTTNITNITPENFI